jgi:integrase
MIISASPVVLALKLSISKETGLRPIELCNLRVNDIDYEKGIIYPSTAKGGSGRTLKISNKTLDMLRVYVHKHNLLLNSKLFKGTSNYYGKHYRYIRNE